MARVQLENKPASNALKPRRDKSPRLLGAKEPIPPICMPIDEKFAKPHKA